MYHTMKPIKMIGKSLNFAYFGSVLQEHQAKKQ